MQLPHGVPAPPSLKGRFAVCQALQRAAVPLSPQAVVNAEMADALHTPLPSGGTGDAVSGVYPVVGERHAGGPASTVPPLDEPLDDPPLDEPLEEPLDEPLPEPPLPLPPELEPPLPPPEPLLAEASGLLTTPLVEDEQARAPQTRTAEEKREAETRVFLRITAGP